MQDMAERTVRLYALMKDVQANGEIFPIRVNFIKEESYHE